MNSGVVNPPPGWHPTSALSGWCVFSAQHTWQAGRRHPPAYTSPTSLPDRQGTFGCTDRTDFCGVLVGKTHLVSQGQGQPASTPPSVCHPLPPPPPHATYTTCYPLLVGTCLKWRGETGGDLLPTPLHLV